MNQYKSLFMSYMDSIGMAYTNQNEEVVSMHLAGNNLKVVTVVLDFGNMPFVRLANYDLGGFGNSNDLAGASVCNQVNRKFNLAKFYLDTDGDVCAQIDAVINKDDCGELCALLASELVKTVDMSFPAFEFARSNHP